MAQGVSIAVSVIVQNFVDAVGPIPQSPTRSSFTCRHDVKVAA